MNLLVPLFSWMFRGLIGLFCLGGLVGCQFDGRQSALDPKGPIALVQYDLFMVTVWVTLFIFITVGGTLLWVVFRFRDRKHLQDELLPTDEHGNPWVEVGLIGLSTALLVVIAIPTVKAVWYTETPPSHPEALLGHWYKGPLSEGADEEILTIDVIGYQWWWVFHYPQLGLTTANEFAIPVGKPVKLNLRSADVIHSFWLPKIAGKVDLIPGRANWMWIQGDEPGFYYGQCAEFCGSAHAYMLFRSEVLLEEDFENWVQVQQKDAPQPTDSKAIEGMKLFTDKTCVLCHKIRGNSVAQGVKGPDLTHIASRKTLAAGIMDNRFNEGPIDEELQKAHLKEWILHNATLKPGNMMFHDPMGGLKSLAPITEQEADALVAYLMTLK
jgi:cytochrome c oxidase subunit 2